MHPWLQHPKAALAALMLAAPLLVNAQSLKVPADALGGATWTARIEVESRPQIGRAHV